MQTKKPLKNHYINVIYSLTICYKIRSKQNIQFYQLDLTIIFYLSHNRNGCKYYSIQKFLQQIGQFHSSGNLINSINRLKQNNYIINTSTTRTTNYILTLEGIKLIRIINKEFEDAITQTAALLKQ